jgi:hypothetical protein
LGLYQVSADHDEQWLARMTKTVEDSLKEAEKQKSERESSEQEAQQRNVYKDVDSVETKVEELIGSVLTVE